MPDALPDSVRANLDDPLASLTGSLAGTTRMAFEVADSRRLSPGVQRITLTAPELAGFGYAPGQDLMLLVGAEGRRAGRRRVKIRGRGPAARGRAGAIVGGGGGAARRWVRAVRAGDRIEGIGPRGKITTLPGADWHLFLGDTAALPAIAAMAEALPGDADAAAVIEVPGPDDEQDLSSPARFLVSWLHRLSRPAGDPELLAAEAAEVELPPGNGHAYLLGEAKVVSRLRDILGARGLSPDQISAKAYWGRGKANADHGEPARPEPPR